MTMDMLLQKPRTTRARFLAPLTFTAVMLFGVCPIHLAQAPKANLKGNHSRREVPPPEDVYFNVDGRQVSSTTSLSATQLSGTSIGSVLSLLFDGARISLQGANDPMVATWSGTIRVPTNTKIKPKPKVYQQDIRGSLNKTADTRVTIFLNLGGKSFVVEFPYGMKHDGDILRRFSSLVKLSASDSYTASILIFAERRNQKGAVLVDIDSLDVAAR